MKPLRIYIRGEKSSRFIDFTYLNDYEESKNI